MAKSSLKGLNRYATRKKREQELESLRSMLHAQKERIEETTRRQNRTGLLLGVTCAALFVLTAYMAYDFSHELWVAFERDYVLYCERFSSRNCTKVSYSDSWFWMLIVRDAMMAVLTLGWAILSLGLSICLLIPLLLRKPSPVLENMRRRQKRLEEDIRSLEQED